MGAGRAHEFHAAAGRDKGILEERPLPRPVDEEFDL